MTYIQLGLMLVGVITLVVGYRKSHRNTLLVAAIALFLAGSVGDFTRGFANGFQEGSASIPSNNTH
ncbi:MAG: hypothetical protein WA777_05855 [Rhodanobacter sp.]